MGMISVEIVRGATVGVGEVVALVELISGGRDNKPGTRHPWREGGVRGKPSHLPPRDGGNVRNCQEQFLTVVERSPAKSDL